MLWCLFVIITCEYYSIHHFIVSFFRLIAMKRRNETTGKNENQKRTITGMPVLVRF